MKPNWQLQDAKARFSELVDRAIAEGPQHVTRRGAPAVVVMSEADYRKATAKPQRSLLELMRSCPAPEIFETIESTRQQPDFGRTIDLG